MVIFRYLLRSLGTQTEQDGHRVGDRLVLPLGMISVELNPTDCSGVAATYADQAGYARTSVNGVVRQRTATQIATLSSSSGDVDHQRHSQIRSEAQAIRLVQLSPYRAAAVLDSG